MEISINFFDQEHHSYLKKSSLYENLKEYPDDETFYVGYICPIQYENIQSKLILLGCLQTLKRI